LTGTGFLHGTIYPWARAIIHFTQRPGLPNQQKPYVPEKIIGTLTSSIIKSVHTLISLTFSFELDSIATHVHPRCFRLKKSRSRRRLTPYLQRVSFYSGTDLFYYSCTTELISSLKCIKRSLPSFSGLFTMWGIVERLGAAVAYGFMQDRHAGRYSTSCTLD